MTSSHQRSVKVTDVNPHLLCVLCGGYYVDATTIIECLHSFCKSCIVRYLETNKYCPICDVQVHKTKPLLNIRSDRTLQAIVYKLVPGLFQRELNCRREFYKKYPETIPTNVEDAGELSDDSPIYLPEEPILLGVQYAESSVAKDNDKRYLRCPAAITIYHLQKLMRAKFNLNDFQMVEFLHDGNSLPDYLSLMDLAYMYHWKRKHTVELEYRLLECQKKKIKLAHEENNPVTDKNKQNSVECEKGLGLSDKATDQPDREVQLQISENGVISVHSVDFSTSSTNNTIVTSKSDDNKSISDDSLPMKDIQPETIELMKSLEKTVSLDFDNSFTQGVENSDISSPNNHIEMSTNIIDTKITSKCKTNHAFPIEAKKEEMSSEKKNKTCNNHDNVNNTSVTLDVPPVSIASTCVSVQKVYPGAVKEISNSSKPFKTKEPTIAVKEHETNFKYLSEKHDSPKLSNNIRYKTLKSPIKPWNPSIPRSSLMAMKQAQSANQEKTDSSGKTVSKTPKFFKMRNVPRFLGNPASGVKPMYQVLPGSELSTQVPQTSTSQNSKHSGEITVMKIDPKTLNPIPTTRTPRSPKLSSPSSKLSPAFVCSSQKPSESHLLNCRTSIRNPVAKSGIMSLKTSSPVHPPNLSNPYIMPSPHSPHMMYSGFPRPFSPVDSSGSRMPSDNQIFRAMSMLCTPGAAFHPSLPPSISMLFNPHHPHHRSSQNEKLNMKYTPSDFHKTASTTTPSVQRVPPSCPTSKHSSTASHSPSPTSNSNTSISSCQNHLSNKLPAKLHDNERYVNTKEIQENNSSPTSNTEDQKSNSGTSILNSDHDQLQSRLEDKHPVSLSNGFSVVLSKCPMDVSCRMSLSKNKEDGGDKVLLKKDTVEQTNSEEIKAGKIDKSSFSKSSYSSSLN